MIVPVLLDPHDRPALVRLQPSLWRCTAAHADRARLRGAARALLQRLLADYLSVPAERVPLRLEPGQPPRVDGCGQDLSLSISYGPGIALVGLCPGARMGVDLVALAEPADWQAVARLYLPPAVAVELAALDAASRARRFALAWAELEARGKCLGQGLAEWSPARQRALYADSIQVFCGAVATQDHTGGTPAPDRATVFAIAREAPGIVTAQVPDRSSNTQAQAVGAAEAG